MRVNVECAGVTGEVGGVCGDIVVTAGLAERSNEPDARQKHPDHLQRAEGLFVTALTQ